MGIQRIPTGCENLLMRYSVSHIPPHLVLLSDRENKIKAHKWESNLQPSLSPRWPLKRITIKLKYIKHLHKLPLYNIYTCFKITNNQNTIAQLISHKDNSFAKAFFRPYRMCPTHRLSLSHIQKSMHARKG